MFMSSCRSGATVVVNVILEVGMWITQMAGK